MPLLKDITASPTSAVPAPRYNHHSAHVAEGHLASSVARPHAGPPGPQFAKHLPVRS